MKKKAINLAQAPMAIKRVLFAFLFFSVWAAPNVGATHSLIGENVSEKQVLQDGKQTVKGSVVDSKNEPLIGVSVKVVGASVGTVTDVDGNFSLSVPGTNAVLEFTYVGYVPQKVKVGSNTSINVTLVEDSQTLSTVVVTALGMSREKKSLGYAMTEVSGDDIARANVVNPIGGLQGKVAGVQINMGTSGPQSASRILIRGNTSLGTNNQPIFIIDGVFMDNSAVSGTEWGAQMDFGNEIKNLNSDDFESVSVLKGAAATALYGSRAASGVILITTKKGKKGEGLGVNVSHSMMWDDVYKFPDIQNQFGPGTTTVWGLNPDGTENRSTTETANFGPRFDGLPYTRNGKEFIFSAKPNNIKQMYQTGNFLNTNVAVQGGDDKSTFRASYSFLQSNGTTLNNHFKRNSFSINASRDISSRLKADVGVAWARSDSKNPTYQGGGKSPIYDFMYSVPRDYDTGYWLQNYKSAKGDGWNSEDPYEYSRTIWDYLENNYTQLEDNIRGNAKLDFKLTNWLSLKLMGDFNKLFTDYERKILATGKSNYDGSEYQLITNRKDQYKLTAMLSAFHKLDNVNINGSAAIEQWDTRSEYHKSYTQGGLRVPGVFDISNSVKASTQEARLNYDRKRINSIYAFVNMDWKSQVYLDITGRNDWSSSLMYTDGSGTVSYFYPSIGSSWIITETFRNSLPEVLSFAKVRASYAIVGNDTRPYLTSIGYYKLNSDPIYSNPLNNQEYPHYEFDASEQRNLALKPEKQHSIELGTDIKFFNNRLGLDLAWYKTNTKNQILALAVANETGVGSRWVNAGNIQNQGVEISLTGTPIETKDWRWDVTATYTKNNNKIIALTDGVDKYSIEYNGMDAYAYATVGGSYGDIYTPYAFTRNKDGEKILNANGSWKRAGEQTKIGSLQPDFLAGLVTTVNYKSFGLNIILDARYGGDIMSGSYNYGSASGTLKHTLYGRTTENGGLARTLTDGTGRIVNDGMIPDGVFDSGVTIGGKDVSGMSYKAAYDAGLVDPISAYDYYQNLFSWGTGIREASLFECSYIAVREISLSWNVPKKWLDRAKVQNVMLSVVGRNLGYLYNSLPDNINPEGLSTNRSTQFVENGGSAYTRSLGFKINVGF